MGGGRRVDMIGDVCLLRQNQQNQLKVVNTVSAIKVRKDESEPQDAHL